MDLNTLKTLEENQKSLNEKIQDLTRQMQENSRKLMKGYFYEFFEKYDEVVDSIFWTQFQPHFNDGEACEFSVHDVWILLKDDENACDYEGSSIYDKSLVEDLQKRVSVIEEWEKDPMAFARKFRAEQIKKRGYDPFREDRNIYGQTKTPEEQMAEWKPFYGAEKKDVIAELERAKYLAEAFPNLKEDYRKISTMIGSIDENLMKGIFGDHVKVIVSKEGIQVEEYEHD